MYPREFGDRMPRALDTANTRTNHHVFSDAPAHSMSQSYIRRFESRVEPGTLMHVLADCYGAFTGRLNLTPEAERLQVGVIRLADDAHVKPHEHIPVPSRTPDEQVVTQESWLVLRGAIRARLYDSDRSLLHEERIGAGGLVVTFRGGHALECAEPGTVLVEVKTGPYLGRDYEQF
jgi:cupin fold WbuC family metalloprotein